MPESMGTTKKGEKSPQGSYWRKEAKKGQNVRINEDNRKVHIITKIYKNELL